MRMTCLTTASVALTISLAGCATTASTEGSKTKDSVCGVFSAITWSEKDTRDTQRQVIGHNAAGKAVCGWVAPKAKSQPKAKAAPKPKPIAQVPAPKAAPAAKKWWLPWPKPKPPDVES